MLKLINMSQSKDIIYECSKCGAQYPKWLGRCSECGSWGTLGQSMPKSQEPKETKIAFADLVDFSQIKSKDAERLKIGIGEFDRVLGGGIVPGSLILLGGDPGIGKSTLILQVMGQLSTINYQLSIYVSAEESAEQVKMRFDRLDLKVKNLKFLNETDIDIICATIKKIKPAVAIVDSIQTVCSSEIGSEAGNVSQIRASTAKLMEAAKENKIAIFIIGHVTKEGAVAGPKTLEHLVDTVLYLEGDRYHDLRILRGVKNRFGSTNEIGIFEMTSRGLQEVKNPSQVFLEKDKPPLPGSIITCVIEGSRSFLVEVQALVSRTPFGYPQRKASGFDLNRLQLLLAVLEKRYGYRFNDQDVFINISGGLKIKEPACDLAICLALISAFKNQPPRRGYVVFGEVSLSGQVRPASQAERRVKEARSLGYEAVIYEVKDIGEAVKSVIAG